MREKLLKLLPSAEKLILAGCVFMTPLIFFTDLTKNPYIAQDLLLALLMCAFLICRALEVFLTRELVLKFSKTDVFMLFFAAVSLVSLFFNLARGGNFLALIGEFSQKGDVFVFSFVGAWFLAKAVNASGWEKFRPDFYFNFALWSFCWFLFNVFGGVFFWIYAVLMWAWAAYICMKRLKDITLFAILDIFLAVCAICCFYGILQNAGLEMIWKININYEFGARAISTFGNPNFLSSYLLIFLPFVFLRFIKARSSVEKFTFLLMLFVFCAYLAISMTRSSWLGAAAGGFILLLFKDFRLLLAKAKGNAAFAIVFSLLVFFLWPSGMQKEADNYSSAAAERIEELSALNEASAFTLDAAADKINPAYHQRLMMWACGLKMFKDAPFIGKGLTSFQMNYGLCQGGLIFRNPVLGGIKTQANEAHNQFVQVLAESGILGFSAFLILLAFGGFSVIKAVRADKNPDSRLIYLCLLAGLAAFCADNMLNITFRAVVPAFAFWFIFSALNNLSCRVVVKKIRAASASLIFASAVLCAYLAAAWQISYFGAEISALKGYKAFAKGDYALAADYLKKADKNSAVRAEAAFGVVNALIQTAKHQEAMAYAERGIKKYPGYYEFYLRAAGIKSGLGDNLAAAGYLKKALLLYPENLAAAQAWAKFVAALPGLRTAENAALAKGLLNIFPYEQELKLAYALSAFAVGDYVSACPLAQKVLEEDLFNPDFYELVKLCAAKGSGGEELLSKADIFRAARAKVKRLKTGSSLEKELSELQSSYSQSPSAALLLAEVYFNNGEYRKSAALLEPYYADFKYLKPLGFALSSAWLKTGEPEKAKEYLRFILSYDKHDEQALTRLKNMENL